MKKRILITGANSYIGTSFEQYAEKHYPNSFLIDTIEMIDGSWRDKNFSGYDAVFHVAGIAHADVESVTEEEKKKYYAVNTDLAIGTAQKAKAEGVKQFVFMSSAIIYGDSFPYGKIKRITRETKPNPENFYGDSKWRADQGVRRLADGRFVVTVLRPPMIYGKGSKGNYPKLSMLAKKLPFFPDVNNERSMLYIENLCEFLCQVLLREEGGIFWPQNAEFSRTSDVAWKIAKASGHRMVKSSIFNWSVALASHIPGKISGLVNKAFGNMIYDQSMSQYDFDYQLVSLDESIKRTEAGSPKTIWIIDHYSSEPRYGGISRQYDFARELGKRGYHVVVIASGFCHFTHQFIVKENRDVRVSRLSPDVQYIYLKTTGYENNGGLGRARNMFSFMRQVLKFEHRIAQKYGRPDVVTGCSVHPLAWPAAWKIARKYRVRFVAEIRDFWPRIWVVSGDKKAYDPMVLFFGAIQWWTFRHADRIIYSMYHGDKYICGECGVDRSKVYMIGQPMDCERFDINRSQIDLLPESILRFVGIEKFDSHYISQTAKPPFLCSFAGYYMTYEGVYVMLEALRILVQERNLTDIRMVFVGSGQEKDGMVAFIQQNRLSDYALVCDRIPKEAVPALIAHSDVCMAHLEVEGHKEVYQYGVSKNKVNEYLYSGACTLYGFLHKDDEVAASGGGLMFEPYDAGDLADKIEYVYRQSPDTRTKYGERGREYIRHTHRVDVLTDRLLEVLFA